jgi:DHA1 family multidrug resistance protein-like MFS transporter
MKEIIREAPLGQIIRFVSGNRLLRYPDEEPGYQIPFERLRQEQKISELNKENDETSDVLPGTEEVEKTEPKEEKFEPIRHMVTAEDAEDDIDVENGQTQRDLNKLTSVKTMARTQTLPYTQERIELERELSVLRTKSIPIQPIVTSTGQILVTWYTTDDQDNPQNWSQKKKSYVSFLIW